MIEFTPWLIAIFSSKLLIYIAFAMSVGGVSAILMIQPYKPQTLPFLGYAGSGVLLGLIMASVDFFLQVGSFAESGLMGMWDQTYFDVLWQSSVGTSYKLRLAGWSTLLLLLVVLRFNSAVAKPISYLYLAVSLVIAASFTWVGHTAEQAVWVRIALTLHIFIAMWWVGTLYPLRQWCQAFPTNTLQYLMHEFGKQASFLVTILLLAGAAISYSLEDGFESLLNSSHGNILLLKIGIVAGILMLAAIHKFRLVPRLNTHSAALALQRSISIEMGLALLILIVTAALSTLVGPSHA